MPAKQSRTPEAAPLRSAAPEMALPESSNAFMSQMVAESAGLSDVDAYNFLDAAEAGAVGGQHPGGPGPQAGPPQPGADGEAPTLRVVSYNIQGGCTAPMNEGHYDVQGTIDAIRGTQADVVALQEVGFAGGFKDNDGKDGKGRGCRIRDNQASVIPARLGMKAHQVGTMLVMVRSGLTITSQKGGAYEEQDHKGADRKFMRTTIRLENGTEIVVYNTHTERFDPAVRQKQITELHRRASGEKLPTVVAGDFNECADYPAELFANGFETGLSDEPTFTPLEPTFEGTREKLRKSSGCQPADSTSVQERIDYIFASADDWTAGEGRVVKEAGTASDHYPIQQDLTYTPGR